MRKFTAAEIIARQMCIASEGRVIGHWHPRAQERWRDFLPQAELAVKALGRGGYSIVAKALGTEPASAA